MANSDVAASTRKSSASAKNREEELENQVAELQKEIKGITETLGKLANEKAGEAKDRLSEAKDVAANEIQNLKAKGQELIGEAQGQAEQYEKQLKDTIREKPLQSVATAVGIGFVLALLTR